MNTDKSLAVALAIAVLVIALILAAGAFVDITFDLFEDGSFRLTGCLPWGICTIGG